MLRKPVCWRDKADGSVRTCKPQSEIDKRRVEVLVSRGGLVVRKRYGQLTIGRVCQYVLEPWPKS